MKKENLFKVAKALHAIKSNKTKFMYKINKNKKMILDEIDTIKSSSAKLPDEYTDDDAMYKQKRMVLLEKYAKKDASGIPIEVSPDTYKIEQPKQFEDELKMLEDMYRSLVTAYNIIVETNQELLDEECDLSFHMININDVPDEFDPDHLEEIMFLIEE